MAGSVGWALIPASRATASRRSPMRRWTSCPRSWSASRPGTSGKRCPAAGEVRGRPWVRLTAQRADELVVVRVDLGLGEAGPAAPPGARPPPAPDHGHPLVARPRAAEAPRPGGEAPPPPG